MASRQEVMDAMSSAGGALDVPPRKRQGYVVTLPQLRQDVENELDSYFNTQRIAANNLHPNYGRLWGIIAEVVAAGGKRLRPYLVVLAYQGYGGQDYRGILPVAAAVELLHVAMLMHDDIIDRDTTRHRQLNVSGRYLRIYGAGKRHAADSTALLAGDLAISGSYELLLTSKLPDADKMMAQRLMAEMIFIVVGGELLDSEATLDTLEAADTNTINELKSAHYSFIGPLTLGAMLAGAPPAHMEALKHFGRALGLSFQLVDDILSLFGDEATTGKSATTDLEEGKPTYLIQQTLARATPRDAAWIRQTIGQGSITDANAGRIRDLATSTGARAETGRLADEYASTARQTLGSLELTAPAASALEEIIDLVVGSKN